MVWLGRCAERSSARAQMTGYLSIHSITHVPIFTTGQNFRHSCLHFLGLHLQQARDASVQYTMKTQHVLTLS